jgi:hypothetical protein
MTKLNDLQSILLASGGPARQRQPLPGAGQRRRRGCAPDQGRVGSDQGRARRGARDSDSTAICRTDGDLSFGVYITAAGCTAIA